MASSRQPFADNGSLPGIGLMPPRVPDKSSGSLSPRFSRHSRSWAAWSWPIVRLEAQDARAIELIDENGGGPGGKA
jgi:hypothetical protein